MAMDLTSLRLKIFALMGWLFSWRSPAPRPKFNVLTATAKDLGTLLNKGVVTSEEIVSTYLSQIEKYNGYLHAVISTPPRDKVLAYARTLDQERKSGQVRGPMHGIPILVKDNTATHPDLGMDTTAGTYALVGSKVPDSAPVIKNLLKAGAIVIGKANLNELSNYRGSQMHQGWSAVGGLTQSPYVIGGKRWDDGYAGHSAVGGSSSGSCAGVAAGFAPVSTGTDTSGSILTPSSRNDVYAMKPTQGLIPSTGIVPISPEFDSAGPIARSPHDIAIMLDAMVGSDGNPNKTYTAQLTGSFDGIRVGVLNPRQWHLGDSLGPPSKDFDDQVDTEVEQVYATLRSMGVTVKEVTMPSTKEVQTKDGSMVNKILDGRFKKTFESYLAWLTVSKVRTLQETMEFMKDHATLEFPPISPNMKRLETAAAVSLSDEEYNATVQKVREYGTMKATGKVLRDNDVHLILGRADSAIDTYYVAPGFPMANLPLGYARINGRPFGMCAIAGAHQEGLLIRFMSAWEKTFNKRQLPTWIGGDPNHAVMAEL